MIGGDRAMGRHRKRVCPVIFKPNRVNFTKLKVTIKHLISEIYFRFVDHIRKIIRKSIAIRSKLRKIINISLPCSSVKLSEQPWQTLLVIHLQYRYQQLVIHNLECSRRVLEQPGLALRHRMFLYKTSKHFRNIHGLSINRKISINGHPYTEDNYSHQWSPGGGVLSIIWVRVCAAHMGGFLALKFSKKWLWF